jgi:3-oxoacyl-[acyl-carrier protein] reductase
MTTIQPQYVPGSKGSTSDRTLGVPMNVKGRIALVTGGGTGIGRAICHALARAGVRAIGVNYSRSRGDAETTVRELSALACEGVALRADVAQKGEATAMVTQFVERFGRLDVLVNNAGITQWIDFSSLDAVTDEAWRDILGVNLFGAFHCAAAAAPALRESNGAIVNIASTSGHRATGSSLPYGVSKAALLHLTRALAVALAPAVRVNSVSPGEVVTRWSMIAKGEQYAKASQAETSARTPLSRCATPEDVAQAVMGLIGCDFVTGQDIIVDGGLSVTY